MSTFIIDIEADGLLLDVTKVHCIVAYNVEEDKVIFGYGDTIQDVVDTVFQPENKIVAHNGIMYDLPVLKRLYGITYKTSQVYDTLIISRFLEPDRLGGHSLKAWGERLGFPKMDFTDFSEFSKDMLKYCINDVRVTFELYKELSKYISRYDRACYIEHTVAFLINRQIVNGFQFDTTKAIELYKSLKDEFDIIYEEVKTILPKKPILTHFYKVKKEGKLLSVTDNVSYTYTAGKNNAIKTKEIEFEEPNPTSRKQIYEYFMSKGWKPTVYTEAGTPQISETILKDIGTDESIKIARMFRLQKQLGMINDGDYGWLKMVRSTGRIHGDVITNGANTGRMTHSKPNVSQVDAKDKRMRELWVTRKGCSLVGCDASGLELRVLGHYLAPYDKGAFAHEVINGDIHTYNQNVAGLTKRASAKTLIYALIYGAGNQKLGKIYYEDLGESVLDEYKLTKAGTLLRDKILSGFTGYKDLVNDVQRSSKCRGFLVGLDGRPLNPRKEYSALNLLIQAAGAIIMKQALINSYKKYNDLGLKEGVDYWYVGNIHDECQIECREGLEELIGNGFKDSIKQVTKDFNLQVELDGEYKIGKNWSETH